jgi:hypothetical protein
MKRLTINVKGEIATHEIKIPFFSGDVKKVTDVANAYLAYYGSNYNKAILELIELGRYEEKLTNYLKTFL